MFKNGKADDQFFIETKMGVLTRQGDWFHTTAEQVNSFAPGLLEKVSFRSLIKQAQAWVNSAGSLSLILLFVLFFFINPWIAAIIAFLFHWFWYHYKSGFVMNKVHHLFTVINSDTFLFIIALVTLSVMGWQQKYTALILGLIFFIVVKPGLLKKGWNRLALKRSADGLLLNDRVLKMIIIKRAMYEEGTSPKEIANMEDKFAEIVANLKSKKS